MHKFKVGQKVHRIGINETLVIQKLTYTDKSGYFQFGKDDGYNPTKHDLAYNCLEVIDGKPGPYVTEIEDLLEEVVD